MKKRTIKKILLIVTVLTVMLSTVGCIKPYDTPEFVTITASQTAFLVPLVGDSTAQASFESEELLAQAKVATKEVQIPHRWVQTGRRDYTGEWRPSATLIVVERKPVSRSWDSGDLPGEIGNAISGETSDAIGIFVAMTCSAQINEEDATKFLYRYNNTPLEQIIDTEIRTRVEDEFNIATSRYTSTELHANKESIMREVKEKVVNHFKEFGITITTLGMKEGISFENDQIQKAIDEKYASEQKLVTQQNANEVTLAKAEADAKAAKIKAEADAEVLKIAADAEAEANRKIAESLTPELAELRKVETIAEKWNGNPPVVTGDTSSFLDVSKFVE